MGARLTYLLIVLGITVGAIGGVELFYAWLGRYFADPIRVDSSEVAGRPLVAVQPTAQYDAEEDRRRIIERNLFATQKNEPIIEEVEQPVEVVPPSTLAMVLMGTIVGPDGLERAIIYDKTQRKQQIYQQGDAIEQTLIKQISRGKVVLNRGGKDEMLDMSEAREIKVANRPPVTPTTSVERVVPRPVGQVVNPAQQQPTIVVPDAPRTRGLSEVPGQPGQPGELPDDIRSFRGGINVEQPLPRPPES
jgi:type II secretory pathway component PulC